MTRRKKIITVSSIVLLLALVVGSIIYYKKKNIKADTASSVVNYYGYVMWSDGTPATGKAISVANRQSIIRNDGQYTFYLSKSDFDHGTVNINTGAAVTFYDPKTSEQYNELNRLTSSSLPVPTEQGSVYIAMSFVLEKVAAPKANNFTLINNAPAISNKTATFSFGFVNPTDVSIAITGTNGRSVVTLTQSFSTGTTGSVTWNGKDSAGRPVAAGTYRASIVGNDNLNPVTTLGIVSVPLK